MASGSRGQGAFLTLSDLYPCEPPDDSWHGWVPTTLKFFHFELAGLAVVIMGVSGSGKSTVGEMLSKDLGCRFLEADDFHTQSNKDKMNKGIPLSDNDRFPWLQALRDATMEQISGGETVVLTCSALQNKYREVLRTADPEYEPGSYTSCRVKFVCMEAPANVIADRIERRSTEGKHFMPVSLLQSQLDLLQIDEDEGIIRVDATRDLGIIIDVIKDSLKGRLNCS
ncbi:hypothetical protein Taro_051097 [Colocasia esculenta]|uniref:Gluconokinase n=1 Tax=Colocasia esculenta TaxID=4460 RepID=A0A843XFU4_COLES|nr:hypothetical protein [Colocasia esculenta]